MIVIEKLKMRKKKRSKINIVLEKLNSYSVFSSSKIIIHFVIVHYELHSIIAMPFVSLILVFSFLKDRNY